MRSATSFECQVQASRSIQNSDGALMKLTELCQNKRDKRPLYFLFFCAYKLSCEGCNKTLLREVSVNGASLPDKRKYAGSFWPFTGSHL